MSPDERDDDDDDEDYSDSEEGYEDSQRPGTHGSSDFCDHNMCCRPVPPGKVDGQQLNVGSTGLVNMDQVLGT